MTQISNFHVEELGQNTIRLYLSSERLEELGEIEYIHLPKLGQIEPDWTQVTIEASKASVELPLAMEGEISKINPLVEDKPHILNQAKSEDSWLFEIQTK